MPKFHLEGTIHFGTGFAVRFDADTEDEARKLAKQWVDENINDYRYNAAWQETCIEVIENITDEE